MAIRGTFCEITEAPAGRFDRRSLRWKRSGADWLLVGCPRGCYDGRRCRVGTRVHKRLDPAHGRCRRGRRIRKG